MSDNHQFDLGSNRPEPGEREEVHPADFHGLRDDIGRIAQQPQFDSVRRRARRLRTRRRLTVAAAGLAVVVMLGAGGLTGAWPSGGDSAPATTRPGPVATSLPPKPQSTGLPNVRRVYPADASHLYVLVDDCPTPGPECQQQWLMASEDGGQTWRPRLAPKTLGVGFDRLRVVGPTALMVVATVLPAPDRSSPAVPSCSPEPARCPSSPGNGLSQWGRVDLRQVWTWRISNDAGATWQDLAFSSKPVVSAPPSGRVVSRLFIEGTDTGLLYAVDPQNAQVAPLATQPPLAEPTLLDVPMGAGVWVEGVDPTTRRPAIAVSHDGGASWALSVFDAELVTPESDQFRAGMYRPEVATADGKMAYATFVAGPVPARIYRSADGGRSWRHSNPDAKAGDMPAIWQTFALADGRHVLATQDVGKGRVTFASSTDGKTYRPLTLTGLPPVFSPPFPVDENLYLGWNDHGVYRSTDGLNWQPLPAPR
ncbi:WD40/YVTN/BNR-like repeat-containing protein [Micromonospora sp. NPDC050397]|uniref:WD40/YVTN/BNR-like repeat-containing protein n=1 Tax=Micromonospora sp. NPDC050397 TaxID=3364279 RepID=UPI00384E48FA